MFALLQLAEEILLLHCFVCEAWWICISALPDGSTLALVLTSTCTATYFTTAIYTCECVKRQCYQRALCQLCDVFWNPAALLLFFKNVNECMDILIAPVTLKIIYVCSTVGKRVLVTIWISHIVQNFIAMGNALPIVLAQVFCDITNDTFASLACPLPHIWKVQQGISYSRKLNKGQNMLLSGEAEFGESGIRKWKLEVGIIWVL